VEPYLEPEVPPLTLCLAPGLGLAENPDGDESFGMKRCRQIAEAVYGVGPEEAGRRTEAVIGLLEKQGIDPWRPHLEPGSDRDYSL
jgi:HopA1 effector protein family